MGLFASLNSEDAFENEHKLDTLYQGSLFKSIEYEISNIVSKIDNIDQFDANQIKDIIIRQHNMILNYDLFLINNDNRQEALKLFTNKRFLDCFINVIRFLDLDRHERICLNKITYDYYILPNKDQEVADMLYRLTTEVNGKEVIVLSGILGMHGAQILSMIRNSTFNEEKAVHRVNTFLIKCNQELSVQQIISIYCYLFERFTHPFVYTMMEAKPIGLTPEQNIKFDNISKAILEILNSLTSDDIRKVLQDYAYTLNMVKSNITVRFSLKSAVLFTRIQQVIKSIELDNDGVNDLTIP